jgi:alkylhydroperoxidase family enzyme
MIMHAKDPAWAAYRTFAIAARDEAPLEPALRELVILRVAYLSRSDYEVYHHISPAVAAGVAPEKLEAVESGDLSSLNARECAVIRFTSQVVENVGPDDATLQAMLGYFSYEELFGIVILITGYMTTARILAVDTEDRENPASAA